MRALNWHLVNSEQVEAWPARLLRPRANADARALATAEWGLRRKRDGRFLAALDGARLTALVPRLDREPGLAAALEALHAPSSVPAPDSSCRSMACLNACTPWAWTKATAMRSAFPVPEPVRLEFAGFDRYRRPLWLLDPAARAWRRMQAAAYEDDIAIEAISGYRSHDYQLGIFERKLARGLSVEQILAVNAAPGYSEHHGGCAMDIGTPGEPPAEESFEATPAFAWLHRRAGDFGFRMSYPRGNPHGIVYEPWHWRWFPAE